MPRIKSSKTSISIRRIVRQQTSNDCGWAACATIAVAHGISYRGLRDQMSTENGVPGALPDDVDAAFRWLGLRTSYIGSKTLFGMGIDILGSTMGFSSEYESKIRSAASKGLVVSLTWLSDFDPRDLHWIVLGPYKSGICVFDVNGGSRTPFALHEERGDYPLYCGFRILGT